MIGCSAFPRSARMDSRARSPRRYRAGPSIPILLRRRSRSVNMAGGWTRDGAVQQQIEDTVKDAILRARALTPEGESAEDCDDCGEPIPRKRREALPGVRTCIACQSERDKAVVHSTINRRGSKDSQLR